MFSLSKGKIQRLTKKAQSLYQTRQLNRVSDSQVQKEINLYLSLAKLYQKHIGDKEFPFAKESTLQCLRAASALNDIESQFELGKMLLDEAKFLDSLKEGMFANNANESRAKVLFEEAYGFLKTADESGNPLAKRLRGLMYINGWGVDASHDKGFQLVVDSIEMENNWDNVTQIFEEIGLNKPEFYTALMTHKSKKQAHE